MLTDPHFGGTISECELLSLGVVWPQPVSPAGVLSTGSNSNIWHGNQWDVFWTLPSRGSWTSDSSSTV